MRQELIKLGFCETQGLRSGKGPALPVLPRAAGLRSRDSPQRASPRLPGEPSPQGHEQQQQAAVGNENVNTPAVMGSHPKRFDRPVTCHVLTAPHGDEPGVLVMP